MYNIFSCHILTSDTFLIQIYINLIQINPLFQRGVSMSRTARRISSSNTYHVMLRGINRQQIFFDPEDYLAFLHVLEHYKDICCYQLYAYCLMGNHVHLLIKTEAGTPEHMMKRLQVAFVYWYNTKYHRTGHLFQGRYRSEVVETEAIFMVVLRYILRNPVKAGLCRFPEEYPYSSAAEYICSEKGITDTEAAFEIMDSKTFRTYIFTENNDQCLDLDENPPGRCTDARAKELIQKEFGTFFPTAGKPKERKAFYCSVRKLLSSGISIRQLSRLTGISKRIIEKARE